MPPENFPAPGQQAQDHTEDTSKDQMYRPDMSYFRHGATCGRSRLGPIVDPSERGMGRPGYQVPPNASSVFASTAAHSASRSSPRVSAIERIVSGTR